MLLYNEFLASSSSLASSTIIGSPKPEKRPFNSPLPPTPTKNPDSVEDVFVTAFKNAKSSSGSPKNLEDMYAKVNKKNRREINSLERFVQLFLHHFFPHRIL